MSIYLYHSKNLDTNVKLTYVNGVLNSVELGDFEIKSDTPAYGQFFISEYAFLNSCKAHGVKYEQSERSVTFDMFWDRYKHKVDKPLAIEQWGKLSREEQIRAYDFIPAYEAQLKLNGGLAKKYAVRYLKHGRHLYQGTGGLHPGVYQPAACQD